jgi:hypothetical protein
MLIRQKLFLSPITSWAPVMSLLGLALLASPLLAVQEQESVPELPWELGTSYVFRYEEDGVAIGSEEFTVQLRGKVEDGYDVNSTVQLANDKAKYEFKTRLMTTEQGHPVSYLRKAKIDEKLLNIRNDFEGQQVSVHVSGMVRLDQEIKLPQGVYCFDSNLMAAWCVLTSFWELEPESRFEIQTFHASALKISPVKVEVSEERKFKWNGLTIEGVVCHLDPLNNNLYFDKAGRLLRVQQGKLIMELAPATSP